MNEPTPIMRLLRWHRAFMRGDNPDRHDGWPECGWYKMQRVKNGPWLPVEIWCDQKIDEHGLLIDDEVIRARVWGEEEDAAEIWTYLKPISRKEFENLTEYRLRNQHILQDYQSIDLSDIPTPIPNGA